MYNRLGYDVNLKSVANGRHEILNEINKEEVYAIVLDLIEGKQDEKG
jgi:alpha-beta hydrolase superfamily lysophospholipase